MSLVPGTFPRGLDESKKLEKATRPGRRSKDEGVLTEDQKRDMEQQIRARRQSRRTARKLGLYVESEEERKELIENLEEENERVTTVHFLSF
jgi:hypothetical protein